MPPEIERGPFGGVESPELLRHLANAFQKRIEDPHAWFIFAGISLRGAAVLWKVSDIGRELSAEVLFGKATLEEAGVIGGAVQLSIPSLLLAGFGFESLLKGILLRQMTYRGEALTAPGRRVRYFSSAC